MKTMTIYASDTEQVLAKVTLVPTITDEGDELLYPSITDISEGTESDWLEFIQSITVVDPVDLMPYEFEDGDAYLEALTNSFGRMTYYDASLT